MQKIKKVIVFGDLPIATKVVKKLMSTQGVKVVGIISNGKKINNNDPWDLPVLKEYAKLKNIPQFKLNELSDFFKKNDLDLGFSCRFSEVINIKVIDLFKFGIINFHGGLLPERRGLNTVCHSILLKDKIAGGTLHYIDEGIDTGKIIAKGKFEIKNNDTSYDIFIKTQILLWNLFNDNIDLILNNKNKKINPNSIIENGFEKMYFNKKSINDKKIVSVNDQVYKKIKNTTLAFDFPNHEPAYIQNENDLKIFLTTRRYYEYDFIKIKQLIDKYKNDNELGKAIRVFFKTLNIKKG